MSTISITTVTYVVKVTIQAASASHLCELQYQQQHEQRKEQHRQEVDEEDEEECNESPTDLPILGEVHVHMAVCHLTKSLHSRIKM